MPPGLALLAFFLGPHDRLPVWHDDQAGVGDFDAVAAGLIDVEEEGLLDRGLVRAGLDVNAVFQKDIGGAQNLLAAVERGDGADTFTGSRNSDPSATGSRGRGRQLCGEDQAPTSRALYLPWFRVHRSQTKAPEFRRHRR